MTTHPGFAPADDQPRERLARHGPGALTTVELLAILLGTGRPGHPAVEVAQGVYRSAGGSLRRLAGLPLGQLRGVGGVSLSPIPGKILRPATTVICKPRPSLVCPIITPFLRGV